MAYKTKAEATKAGKVLKALMNRPELWEIKVWENIGWHMDIMSGSCRVGPNFDQKGKETGYYDCMIGFDGSGHGEFYRSKSSLKAAKPEVRGEYKDPNVAVEKEIEYAKEQLDRLTFLIFHARVSHGEQPARR